MVLAKPAAQCAGCPLFELDKFGFSQPEGSGALGVLIVGEALGMEERASGLPFRPWAQAGSILDRCIRRAGFDREQFAFTNILQCQPPFNRLDGEWYEYQAIEKCRAHFDRVLDSYHPNVILALGNIPLRTLTGMAGRNRTISSLRGFGLTACKPNYPIIIPSFHPSFIARGAKNLIGVLIRDIQFAVQVAEAGGITYAPTNYNEHPSIGEAIAYLNFVRSSPWTPISYDIETDYSTRETDESEIGEDTSNITQIQFSHAPHEAIVFPWHGEYINIAKDILALPSEKWGWNVYNFDNPKLYAAGCEINGDIHDLMWQFHLLQPDIPRNLQFATSFYAPDMRPWKHLSVSDPELYGGSDVDSVQRIGARLFGDIKLRGLSNGYEKHIFQLWPILKRMCERGLPIDLRERELFRTEIERAQKELDIEIQSLVPESIRGVHPTLGYKVLPREYKQAISDWHDSWNNSSIDEACNDYNSAEEYACFKTGLVMREFDGKSRPCRIKPFLPSSSDQLKAYMRANKHLIPIKLKDRNLDGTAKETTEKKELEKLWKKTKDPFYLKVVEARELQKMFSTYVEGWRIGADGRVHSTFTFAPANGQLSSRNPNIQNGVRHGRLAKPFRKTIAAPPGHTLIEIDLTGADALMLGFLAKDPTYMRIARLDIHSYITAHLLKLPNAHTLLDLSDVDLLMQLATIKRNYKEVRDVKAKRACIAEGQLVLTNRGEVPIENITVDDLVWDGVEWVQHEGVIWQGIKEIITHDGLTATPDHKVFTADGGLIPLAQAKAETRTLERTGFEGQEIRTSYNHFFGDNSEREKELQIPEGTLSSLWARGRNKHGELNLREDNGMLAVRETRAWVWPIWNLAIYRSRTSSKQAIFMHYSTLPQSTKPTVLQVWRAGHKVPVQILQSFCSMDNGEPSASYIYRNGIRPDRQQRTLCAGESTACYPRAADAQYAQQYSTFMARTESIGSRLGEPLFDQLDVQACITRNVGRGDYRTCQDSSRSPLQGTSSQDGMVARSRVYDILNAGPRHRFTVSGRLVQNCHGYGFGLGGAKLYDMNREAFANKKEAQALLDLIDKLFPKVAQFRADIKELASRQGYLKSAHGYIRHFHEVFSYSQVSDSYEPKAYEKLWVGKNGKRYKFVPGEDAEAAIAFLPANARCGVLKDCMLRCEEKGYNEKYGLINQVHDSLLLMPPNHLVDSCIADVGGEMEQPSLVLIDPIIAPRGLAVGVEASVGQNWGELKTRYVTPIERLM